MAYNQKPPPGPLSKAQREADGKKAMAEYEASAEAMRAKTEKLRALRLARDAANGPPPELAKKTGSGKAAGKAAKKTGKKGQSEGTLSDWLTQQHNSGRDT